MVVSSNSVAGGYWGGAVGPTSPDDNGFESDVGFKLVLGAQTTKYFAIEAAYVDLGGFDADSNTLGYISYGSGVTITGASIEISGIDLSAKGIFPVNDKLSIFARAGLLLWDADLVVTSRSYGSYTESDDGSDALLALGLNVDVNEKMALSLEHTMYEAADGDIDFTSVGFKFSF
jgi:hypothetical protein